MGRKQNDSLKYFPLVVDFFEDDKRIRRLINKFGADGALYYIYILCKAYSNGYYVKYDEDFINDAATDIKCSENKISLMTKYLSDKSLLDSKLLDTVNIITSHGIQSQYQESMKLLKRDVTVNKKWWILDEEETLDFIVTDPEKRNSGNKNDKSGINDDNSGKNTVNKRKENKEKQTIKEESDKRSASQPPPSVEEIAAYARENRHPFTDPQKFYDYYSVKGWPSDWKATFSKWAEDDEDEYNRKAQEEFDRDLEWQSFIRTRP